MSFKIVEQAPARLNRSELAVPGSQPKLFEKAAASAADLAAFSKSCGWLPGTASSLRLSRAGACSMVWKLMGIPSRDVTGA